MGNLWRGGGVDIYVCVCVFMIERNFDSERFFVPFSFFLSSTRLLREAFLLYTHDTYILYQSGNTINEMPKQCTSHLSLK